MKIVLFDMDGTLTPARSKMPSEVLNALIDLQKAGYEIGIVTGSDLNYLKDQCSIIFDDFVFDHKRVYYFPCNVTKRYQIKGGCLEKVYEYNMIEKLGKSNYRLLVSTCINIQRHIVETTNCPLSGLFFDYRGSMLNWCPIGRLASKEDRRIWEAIDKDSNIRKTWLSHFNQLMISYGIKDVTAKLGGDTSFDIFPTGWDKTFVLSNFKDEDEIYFIGDRCQKNGNDKELYDAIKLRINGGSFETSGPMKTIDIIRKHIINQRR